jgi:acyl-CoA dehydrogenase
MIKVTAPNMACRIIDRASQVFGGARVTGDYGLAFAYATARVLRLADGPDEVRRNQIARLELRKYQGPASLTGGSAEILPADRVPGLRARPVWIA